MSSLYANVTMQRLVIAFAERICDDAEAGIRIG